MVYVISTRNTIGRHLSSRHFPIVVPRLLHMGNKPDMHTRLCVSVMNDPPVPLVWIMPDLGSITHRDGNVIGTAHDHSRDNVQTFISIPCRKNLRRAVREYATYY